MRSLPLPSGATMPVLGQGTWGMGERTKQRSQEIDALKFGIDLGMTLIDTAEMYGEGGAEEVVAEAIKGQRSRLFLVSKVYPHNATRRGTIQACDRSLKRLKTDYLDLYLLHWRGSVPLSETFEALLELRQSGKIRDFGVSNFDQDDLVEARQFDHNLTATDQVLYNLSRRGIEWDVLPWCRQQGIPVMAYSPIEQGRLLKNKALGAISRLNVTPAQVAISWLLHQENVVVIPKSSRRDRIQENYAALDITLSQADLAALDEAFPPPARSQPLEML
ncbi:MAG: aldo/keto reductase [Myxacorys californica WJT36-NPBG1]|nr:aldo/keto reductase [Myxacorys californica WJT36-NPBG1]